MSISYRVGLGGASTVDLGDVMYLGDIPGWTERADGTYGTSGCTLQDPTGTLSFYGLNKWQVEESDAAWPRIFNGIVAARRIKRGTYDRTDVHAIWELDVNDLNGYLHLRVIRDGNHGNRPAETDVERVGWLLDEVLNNGHVINGTGGFFGANGPAAGVLGAPRNLDAADYRGQHADDVLADIGPPGNRRFFCYYDPDLDAVCLFYGLNTEYLGDSDIRISNVLADLSDPDTFWPILDAEETIDPQDVNGGVYYIYKSGQKRLYREDPDTIGDFLDRSVAITNDRVGSDATASTFVDRLLDKMGTERYSISATIRLPKERVNDVVAGQRMEVKFSHLPGFESFTFMHVIAKTVAQDFPNKDFYTVKLELSDYVGGIGTGGSGGGGPFVPGNDGGGSCAGGAYPLTPAQHFDPLGSGTSDADGYVLYSTTGPFSSPQPFFAGGMGFPVYNGPSGPDFTGDCVGVGVQFQMVGAGVLTIETAAGTSVKDLKATVYHWASGSSSIDYVTTGITIGDSVVMPIPADGSDNCVHSIIITDDVGACGGSWGYAGADWAAGAANTPGQGQEVTESFIGDGVTTTFQTNYAYLPNSLKTKVGGVSVVPDQTDPAGALGELPFAPPLGTLVLITYQAANGVDTGAGNDPNPPSTTPTIPPDVLGPVVVDLDDLGDVVITSVADGDLLTFDSGSGDWINAAPTAAPSLVVEDEGTPLTTDATTLNFTGAGVTASGAGATKTINIPGTAAGVASWELVIDEDGTSFANFTAINGTWSSNGTEIIQTNVGGAYGAYHNTKVPLGYGYICEVDIWFHSAGQGGGGFNYGALLFSFPGTGPTSAPALILDLAGDFIRVQTFVASAFRADAFTVNADTWYTLRVVFMGSTLSAYVDGVLKLSFGVPGTMMPAIADYVGLATYVSTVKFRNYKVWTLSAGAP